MTAITTDWRGACALILPGPVGFVMSGGASLGSARVGMLPALPPESPSSRA